MNTVFGSTCGHFLSKRVLCVVFCAFVESLQREIRLHCVFVYPTGGPAEGNAGQLPVSGGWFHTGFIKTFCGVNKRLHPNDGWE